MHYSWRQHSHERRNRESAYGKNQQQLTRSQSGRIYFTTTDQPRSSQHQIRAIQLDTDTIPDELRPVQPAAEPFGPTDTSNRSAQTDTTEQRRSIHIIPSTADYRLIDVPFPNSPMVKAKVGPSSRTPDATAVSPEVFPPRSPPAVGPARYDRSTYRSI